MRNHPLSAVPSFPANQHLALASGLTRLAIRALQDTDLFALRFAERERLRRLLTRLTSTITGIQKGLGGRGQGKTNTRNAS